MKTDLKDCKAGDILIDNRNRRRKCLARIDDLIAFSCPDDFFVMQEWETWITLTHWMWEVE